VLSHSATLIVDMLQVLSQAKLKWLGVPSSKATNESKGIVLRHLDGVAQALSNAPHLGLEHSGTPHGSFEKAFVPAYNEQLAEGHSEAAAKNGGAPRAFLAQMLAETPCANSHMNHQMARAEGSAQSWAVRSEVGKHQISKVIAAQVEPGSRMIDLGAGVQVSKMRVLIQWQGFRGDVIDADDGLTWQHTSQLTEGVYRQYKPLLDDFVTYIVANTAKDWPFKRLRSGNDKEIVFGEGVPVSTKSHVRAHPSSNRSTKFK
jgi:hypothetical protein